MNRQIPEELQNTLARSAGTGWKRRPLHLVMPVSKTGYSGIQSSRLYIEVGMGVRPLPMSQFAGIYEDNRLILEGGMTELVR